MSKGLKRKLRMRSIKGIKREINDNNKQIEKYNSWLNKEYIELKEGFDRDASEAEAKSDFPGYNAAKAMLLQIDALKRKTEFDLRFIMADNEMLKGMLSTSLEDSIPEAEALDTSKGAHDND